MRKVKYSYFTFARNYAPGDARTRRMRWYIIHALLVKEWQRCTIANRGGIALAILLVVTAVLLSVFAPSDSTAGTGVVGGVHHCYVEFDAPTQLIKHLEENVPRELSGQLVFRKAREPGRGERPALRADGDGRALDPAVVAGPVADRPRHPERDRVAPQDRSTGSGALRERLQERKPPELCEPRPTERLPRSSRSRVRCRRRLAGPGSRTSDSRTKSRAAGLPRFPTSACRTWN